MKKLRRTLAPKADYSKGLSTGLVTLNLACTNHYNVGLLPGHIYLLVGQSQAGKTWMGKQILAEASINHAFDEYALYHDNPEQTDLIDDSRFFGDRMARRVKQPGPEGASRTSEEYYANIHRIIKKGRPFISVLDSEDALSSDSEMARMDKKKGSMGMEKAKANSAGLRVIRRGIKDTNSIVVIVKQVRQNVGPTAMFNPETKSGGMALTYYADLELWFKIIGRIKRKVHEIDRTVGTNLRITVKKNRLSGNDWMVDVPFYKQTGFDNIGSCVEFLIAEGRWKGTKTRVVADDMLFRGKKEVFIREVQAKGLETELFAITTEVWHDIQNACRVERKSPYHR